MGLLDSKEGLLRFVSLKNFFRPCSCTIFNDVVIAVSCLTQLPVKLMELLQLDSVKVECSLK